MGKIMSSPKKRSAVETDTTYWEQLRGKIFSRKGGWVIGEAVHSHGYSLLEDLAGKKSFFQVLLLNATGRLPPPELTQWVEAVYICMSWPDHRIWCNQIGSLAGTMGCTCVAGVSAGILATDSRMYGVGPLYDGVAFIVTALQRRNAGMSIEEIIIAHHRENIGTPSITGYARPIAKGDERVNVMKDITAGLGFKTGPHLSLAYEIEDFMIENHSECLNINGFSSAFLSDQGFSSEEIYRLSTTVVHAGVHACYAETADAPPESFFPLRCEDINYQGAEQRPLPKTSTESI